MTSRVKQLPLVRQIEPGDLTEWMELWQGYQEFYKTSIPDETSQQTWQRFLDPAEPMSAALATIDGKPVGLVHWIRHRSCWTISDYCYLQDLFVSPAARGTGLGRALIEHVYAEAEKAGCGRVYWLTHETNTDAMTLYDRIADKSGFVQYRKMLG